MALLYDPGDFMPTATAEFPAFSWMLTWPTGPWHIDDLHPGGTVFLVRAGIHQRIVWETRVVRSFAVPYEALEPLVAEVRARWGVSLQTATMTSGGFCIGWQAEPVAHLDRGPIAAPAGEGTPDPAFDLDGFQETADLSTAFLSRWRLPVPDPPLWSGRPAIGWFGPQ